MLHLDFFGARATIDCDDPSTLANLERDFRFFKTGAAGPADIRLSIRENLPRSPQKKGLLRWRSARISHARGNRWIDYEGKAALRFDPDAETGTLYGASGSLSHELGFLFLTSRAGEILDRRGLHRVHALGFAFQGEAGLLVLPMGGGKSRLALEMLKRESFEFLADDIPLLSRNGRSVLPFPLRLGLRGKDGANVPERFRRTFVRRRHGPKTLVDFDFFSRKIGGERPLRWLILGKRDGRPDPALLPCSKARALSGLIAPLVLGVGAPQVLELMLPAPPFVSGSLDLLRIAAKRFRSAWGAARTAQTLRFFLGPDPKENVDRLERTLGKI